jgi:hypothetical protein
MAIFNNEPCFFVALMFALFGLLALLGFISESTLVCTVLTTWGLFRAIEFVAIKWFIGKISA